MASPELRLVDANGEIVEAGIDELQALRDQVKGLERDIRGWTQRYAELKRDKQAEAEADPLWPMAIRCFKYWQAMTGHTRCAWTVERFDMVRPYLKSSQYGVSSILRAIAGAKHDPWRKPRKNGSTYVHDMWDHIFAKPATFEEFCNKAPKGWKRPDVS